MTRIPWRFLAVTACCLLFYFMTTAKRENRQAHITLAPDVPLLMVLVAYTDSDGNNEPSRPPYLDAIIKNRQAYADRHGYQLVVKNAAKFKPTATEMRLEDQDASWIKLYALREVLEERPEVDWIWYLDPEALIMDPAISMTNDIIRPSVLKDLILRDVPVVPGASIIQTLKNPDLTSIAFLFSHDLQNVNTHSFLLRQGSYAKYMVETWHDPLYRTYTFEHHAVSALEHMLQWHYQILAHAALVPKRLLCSYANGAGDMSYREGDFVLYFEGCSDPGRSCAMEIERYLQSSPESKSAAAPVAVPKLAVS